MDPLDRRSLDTIPEGVSTGRSIFARKSPSGQHLSQVAEASSVDDEPNPNDAAAATTTKRSRSIVRGKVATESWSSMDEASSESASSVEIVFSSEGDDSSSSEISDSNHEDYQEKTSRMRSSLEKRSSSSKQSETARARARIRRAYSDESSRESRVTTDSSRRRRLEQQRRDIAPERALSSIMMGTWVKPEVPPETEASLRYRFRMFCGSLVENPNVQLAIIFLILANAIALGIGTFDFVTENPDTEEAFHHVDTTFLSIFTIELGLQLIYRGVALFEDSWLAFDFVFVALSWSVEWLQVSRSVRVFRAFRLVTRIESLRTLVLAIGSVMPSLSAIALLMALVFYIFAVLFTQLFREIDMKANYFGDLPHSLFTCMQFTTMEWAEIAREVMAVYSWAWAPIMAFICVTGFVFFNLFIAVICDALKVVEQQSKEERKAEEKAIMQRESEIFEATAEDRILYLRVQIAAMKERESAIADAVAELAGEWNLQRREIQRRQHLQQRQYRERIHLRRISSNKVLPAEVGNLES